MLLLVSCVRSQETYISKLKSTLSNYETVYILENDSYVPYIIISDNYSGNTLLLRENILDDSRRFNEYSSLYENSEIDVFLNNSFINF